MVDEQRVQFVVDRFNAMLADDGARLEVEAGTVGAVRLRYVEGPDGACRQCVLAPSDLEALVGEALGGVAVTVTRTPVPGTPAAPGAPAAPGTLQKEGHDA